ncbi:OFA family MFS transporter [Candidatus Bathyarchaeota archaeon]|nr:OFA family MFS transporter [Candidatus Bathyarchaeota archaeon]
MQESAKVFGVKAESGRWLIVIAGLMTMFCLGAIYAYSVIAVPLRKVFEASPPEGYGLAVTSTEMQIPFIVFLFVFAVTMPLTGKYIEKYGPKKIALVGAVFVGLGWFLASFATSPWTLIFLYGVIGGLGVGIAYNCPIVTSTRWFPDRRGLAVGLTVLGFGFSAAIVGPLVDFLVANFGVFTMFQILGVLFFVLMVIFAFFLRFPPAGWKPKGWKPPESKAAARAELTRGEMVKTGSFYALWICYTIGTLAGLMAIGVAKSVGLEVANNAGINEAEISTLLTALMIPFACCNGFGRPLFGWITDKLAPKKMAIISFTLILLASLLIYTNPASIIAYVITFAILWLNLGGWLAIAPAATAYFFGTKDYARNYGLVFTAYGAGAVIGNILAGQAKDLFGAYIMVFPYVMALAIVGIIIAAVALKSPKPKD